MNSNYVHHEIFPLGPDATPYRLLTTEHVATREVDGREILEVDAPALTLLADQAMRDCQHLLRPGHLAQLRKIIDDPEASANDRFVAFELLKNANIAGGGRAADVPGHRHRDHHGQEGRERLDLGRRRSRAQPGHPQGLHRDQPALQPDGAARHVQGGQHRHQPAGADRPLRHQGQRLQVHVHGQGRRLGQQELSLPGDQGAAESEAPGCSSSTRRSARSAPPPARPTTSPSSSAARRPR